MSVIAFDGVCLGDGPATGVGRAFLDGLRAFAASGDEECVLLTPECAELEDLPGVRRVTAPRGRLRRQRQLPGLLRALGADLLHSSVAAVPLRAPCPTIATVHDLPWFHPELGERPSWWRRFATARALRSAARVLAPSTMTMRDARRLLGRDGDRVALVPHGALEATTTPEEQRDGPLLVLGDDRPRKNRARVAAAHARLDPSDRPPLRFVGPPDDYVDEAEKRALLQRCRAVVHASRFEGFGLPVLEALAHGAPLVCSDIEPLREIAGDVPRYVDPDDTASIEAGLEAVLRDRDLRRRQVSAGPARAANFSLRRLADNWRRVHAEVLR
ncbi:MAG: glycosyltransferase family 1 protein [Planctomycetota bacterium]|nr:glycosyltransferase family 1 protein [Planctomycetota bacterium]